ncbi:hypothetical protein [Actinacidiphila paucisporea]|nr:hypothetical protein [Actinacidiphila paucisporea]
MKRPFPAFELLPGCSSPICVRELRPSSRYNYRCWYALASA